MFTDLNPSSSTWPFNSLSAWSQGAAVAAAPLRGLALDGFPTEPAEGGLAPNGPAHHVCTGDGDRALSYDTRLPPR